MKTRSSLLVILTLAGSIALAGVAQAQTVTVTISADVIDVNAQTATIADLPGPDGQISFSEAMIASNNTPGHQTIGFAIPTSDWPLQFLYPGRAVLLTNTGFYFRAYDQVTIDGTTQTAFTGDTNPDGGEVVIHSAELYLNADFCTLVGFDSTSVSVTQSSGLVQGNTLMNISLFGGSGNTVQGNTGGTIKIDRSNDNVVIGNTVQRVRVLGGGSSQPALNNVIGGPAPSDRNFLTGYGTWNSEGLPAGAAVQLAWTRGTLIQNNSIGTTTDGLAQGNLACTMGINVQSENHDLTIRDNRIAGILGHGTGPHHAGQLFGWAIYFWGSATNVLIAGNTIGLDANGQPTLGSVWGVNVDNFSGYSVDGVSVTDNVIAGHYFNGIRVGPTANMRLARNSIHHNGWIGIDLIPDNFQYGVSPNDTLDLDKGGNGVQNFPEITSAVHQGATLRVVGTLHTSPLDAFTVELFASPSCHADGHGEGEVFLGSTPVSTDAGGDAAFDVALPALAPQGWVVTATATLEPLGLTSELSACVPIDPAVGTALCFGDGSTVGCPCGNTTAPGSGQGCTNSTGVGALLGASGSTSVSADDLVLHVSQAPPGKVALFIQGGSSIAAPFLDGILCAGSPIKRLEAVVLDPAGAGASTGSIVSMGNVTPGATLYYQTWFRDKHGPCATAGNLSAALQVDWQ